MIARPADIHAAVSAEPTSFAELLSTVHALKFTGTITLHCLNGQPQMATLGQPLEVRFCEHPANKREVERPAVHKPLDTADALAPSSPP